MREGHAKCQDRCGDAQYAPPAWRTHIRRHPTATTKMAPTGTRELALELRSRDVDTSKSRWVRGPGLCFRFNKVSPAGYARSRPELRPYTTTPDSVSFSPCDLPLFGAQA